MKNSLLSFFLKIEPDKKKSPFLHTLYDGFFTFAFAPNHVTKGGVHVRDVVGDDLHVQLLGGHARGCGSQSAHVPALP